MPIAGYIDFQACVSGMQEKQNYDKTTAEKVCGRIQAETEKTSNPETKYLDELKNEYGNQTRLFIGHLSTNTIDKEGDKITTEAFKKVMPTFMRRGVLIDSHTNKVIGRPLKYWTNERTGSTTVGWQIYDDYHIDHEAWDKIRNGTYEGMSIGGFAVPGKHEVVCDTDGCHVVINEIELWEGSAVKHGANTGAVIIAHNELAKEVSEPNEDITVILEDSSTTQLERGVNVTDKDEEGETVELRKQYAEDAGSVEEPVVQGEPEGGVEEPVGATTEQKLDAVIELLQNLVGRVEVMEERTAPSVEVEEKEDTGGEDGEGDGGEKPESPGEMEKTAAIVREEVRNALKGFRDEIPGVLNKSLKTAGFIHTPRPIMKEDAGTPLKKSDDGIVTMDKINEMNKGDLRQAGERYDSMTTRRGDN